MKTTTTTTATIVITQLKKFYSMPEAINTYTAEPDLKALRLHYSVKG